MTKKTRASIGRKWGIWIEDDESYVPISIAAIDPRFKGSRHFSISLPWETKAEAEKFLNENKPALSTLYGRLRTRWTLP